MPKQRFSAKGGGRATRYILALAGRNLGKGRESFKLALKNKKKQGKRLPASLVRFDHEERARKGDLGLGKCIAVTAVAGELPCPPMVRPSPAASRGLGEGHHHGLSHRGSR